MNTGTKKLLLIMPPQQGLLNGFATALISLVNFIKARMPGLHASILDMSSYSFDNAEFEITRELAINQHETLFVGITTTTASYQSALNVARFVKQIVPQSVIILGGHHASADPEIILYSQKNIVDLIIAGEGERSLSELIYHYPALQDVPGLCYLDDAGQFIKNDPPILLTQDELDSIPIAYGNSGLIGTPGKFNHATYVSARGCALRCNFCSVGNTVIRTKSIPAVVRDIELLLDMGFKRIAIEDNFFAQSPSRTHEICKALIDIKRRRRDRAFSWDCQTRVESLLRKDTMVLLEQAGCEAVYIGVESLHPDQLTYLNKTNNPLKYLESLTQIVVPALLATNIECYLNLQFGLPGETENHERSTCATLESLGRLADACGKTITIFPQLHVVYPGTAHFQQGVSQGRFPKDVFETFTKWEFQQTPVLYWLGEHFAHGTGGIPEGILNPEVLREGSFENVDKVVDTKAVFKISATLRAIDRIKGVRTFSYGDHIVTDINSPGVVTTLNSQDGRRHINKKGVIK